MSKKKHSLREYESLRALILTGTTTAAAKKLGTSQSAVSRAIAQLEEKTGEILFERKAGRMLATSNAMKINQSLEPLFDSLSKIDQQIWLSPQQEEVLRIGTTPTFAHRFIQKLIPTFLREHPNYRISFEICTSNILLSAIAEQRLDIGITDTQNYHAGVDMTPFLSSYAMCIIPANHRLSQKQIITPIDLAGENYIALIRRLSSRNIIDQVFRSAGVEPQITIETATSISAAIFVQEGLGVTLINPFPIAKSLDERVVLKPFEPKIEHHSCFVTSSVKPLNSAGRSFQEHIQKHCDDFHFHN